MREMKDSGIEWIGKIPKNWNISKIKYLFYIESGGTPSSNEENWDGDVIWITPADYKTDDKYIKQGKRNISQIGCKSCSATIVPAGSIIFSKRAPIGSVAISEVDLSTNQGCLSCVKKTDEDIRYFYYLMSIATERFELLGSGTTFKEISASSFASFDLPFPSVAEQQIIADYLDNMCSNIDALISDIESQIDILEQYKRSVITEAVTKGLNPNVEMKDSGVEWIGKIPKDWEVTKAKYCIVIHNGTNPQTDGDIPVYGSGSANFRTCGEFKKGPAVLLGRKGSINIPHYIEGKYWNIDTAFDVQAKNNIKLKYYFYLAESFAYDYYMSQTTLPSMTQSNYENMIIPLPSITAQNTIVEYLDEKCSNIDAILEGRKAELATLKEYKKSLIYEYVTGKKEVPTL